ncbi:MAG: tRNA 2-thiouridine(34) synthase MnmA [Planctomycetota bacterium]|jgi:tRNA-specific 2-thiouridylase
MSSLKGKVLVAISGGVDSSTTAALLCKKGYECTGVFMITNENYQNAQQYAENVAAKLDLQLHIIDLRDDFEKILDYFCNEYRQGRTPNPCVVCNRYIKFGKLWEFAVEQGADFLATGHYARILQKDGNFCLYRGIDKIKEQSYFLAMVKKEMLRHIFLPMGEYTKQKTLKLSEKLELGCEKREESQEICFLSKNWVDELEEHHPELVQNGNVIDDCGSILGQHQGIHRFTIGQRRGLGIAMGEPYYVTKIDAANNIVTLGPKEEVMHQRLIAKDVNWLIDKPTDSFRALVKVRYNSKGAYADIYPEEDYVRIEFDERVLAVTPGQLAVFYIKDENGFMVAGGGWIEEVID